MAMEIESEMDADLLAAAQAAIGDGGDTGDAEAEADGDDAEAEAEDTSYDESPLDAVAPTPAMPVSPFALQDDHEFPAGERSEKSMARVAATAVAAPAATAVAAPTSPVAPTSPSHSPLPGTALSPFRHCACIAVLPGRVCPFCLGVKWTRICPECSGEGRVQSGMRGRADRTQPCGYCGTKGVLPASLVEVRAAEAAALAEGGDTAIGPQGNVLIGGVGPGDGLGSSSSSSSATADLPPAFRRAVRLPGIGATDKKRRVKVLPSQRRKQSAADRAAKAG